MTRCSLARVPIALAHREEALPNRCIGEEPPLHTQGFFYCQGDVCPTICRRSSSVAGKSISSNRHRERTDEVNERRDGSLTQASPAQDHLRTSIRLRVVPCVQFAVFHFKGNSHEDSIPRLLCCRLVGWPLDRELKQLSSECAAACSPDPDSSVPDLRMGIRRQSRACHPGTGLLYPRYDHRRTLAREIRQQAREGFREAT
jgi:hypothetical protein